MLDGVYEAELVAEGLIDAIWLESAEKSGSLLTVPLLMSTRPDGEISNDPKNFIKLAYRSRWFPGSTCTQCHQRILESCWHRIEPGLQ